MSTRHNSNGNKCGAGALARVVLVAQLGASDKVIFIRASIDQYTIATSIPILRMRITVIRTSLILTVALIAGSALAHGKQKTSGEYDALVERVKQGDQTVDFRQLRIAYSESAHYSEGPDVSSQKKAMMQELRGKEFDKAIKDAGTVLESDYVDMDAHYAEYVAHRELKEQERSDFHKFVFEHLLHSITDHGDGKTTETAYQVIDVHEEYILLRSMGVGLPKSQALMNKDGHSYDEIKFVDPKSQEERTLFFNVDIPIKHGL